MVLLRQGKLRCAYGIGVGSGVAVAVAEDDGYAGALGEGDGAEGAGRLQEFWQPEKITSSRKKRAATAVMSAPELAASLDRIGRREVLTNDTDPRNRSQDVWVATYDFSSFLSA